MKTYLIRLQSKAVKKCWLINELVYGQITDKRILTKHVDIKVESETFSLENQYYIKVVGKLVIKENSCEITNE